MDLSGKRVAVIGAGASGFSAARLAASRGAAVTAFDSGEPGKLQTASERFGGMGIELITGEAALSPRESFDLAVISPGISTSWPIGRAFCQSSRELIGEIELAWRLGDVPVIAVTGTNGKTTTTELIAYLLNECGMRSVAAGNYGYAYSEVVLSGEPYDWIALETSSFQLETIVDFRPRISVWTNFAPDHMDRYKTLEEYREAKRRIFLNQTEDDVAIIRLGESLAVKPNTITFSGFNDRGDYSLREGKIIGPLGSPVADFAASRLNGRHNAENVMAAIAAVSEAGAPGGERLAEAIGRYRPPAHRCEVVATIDGVCFVNDSKATNLHALESALLGQEGRVTLIAGGKEKGLDFRELQPVVSEKVASAICIGEIAGKIVEAWEAHVPCRLAESLDQAVRLAYENRGDSRIVLFSPGTSSFDMFSGYEERGDRFREAVAALRE